LEGLKKYFSADWKDQANVLNLAIFVHASACQSGAAIGSTLAASSYLSRMHSEKGDLLKFFKKGDENSVLGRLETLRNYLKKHREWKPSENSGPLEGQKKIFSSNH
jgi:hypothetical protein